MVSPRYVPSSSVSQTLKLLWILLTSILCFARANDSEYIKTPGTVSVIRGGPSILSFQPSLPNTDIYWCYWKYAGCERPEGCPNEPFIGYTIVGKHERENISRRHEGWIFENKHSPCEGGLRRGKTEKDHKGWYQMIYEDMDRKEYSSDFFPLNLYENVIRDVEISINNKTETLTMSGNDHELSSIDGIQSENYVFSLTLQSDMPPGANVRILRSNSDGTTMVIPRCAGPDNPTCEFVVGLSEEKDVVVEAQVDTGIQGSEVVEIKQTFNYDGTPGCSCSASIVFAVLFFLVALAELAVIGWFLLIPWYRKRSKKKGQDEPRNKSDDMGKSVLVMLDAPTEQNPLMVNLHDNPDDKIAKMEGELSTERELTSKQNIALLDKEKILRDAQEKNDSLKKQLDKKYKEVNAAQSEIKDLNATIEHLKGEKQMAPRFMQFPGNMVFKLNQRNIRITGKVIGNPKPSVTLCKYSRGLNNHKVNMSKLGITQEFKDDVFTLIVNEVTKKLDDEYVLEAKNGIGDTGKYKFAIEVGAQEEGESGKHKEEGSMQQELAQSGQMVPVDAKGTELPNSANVSQNNDDSTSEVEEAQEVTADDQQNVSEITPNIEPGAGGVTGAGTSGPIIIQGLVDCSLKSGEPATLSIKAEGEGTLTATWSIDGRPFNSQHVQFLEDVDGTFSLYIKHISATSRGKMKCVIKDGNGKTAETEASVDVSTVMGTGR